MFLKYLESIIRVVCAVRFIEVSGLCICSPSSGFLCYGTGENRKQFVYLFIHCVIDGACDMKCANCVVTISAVHLYVLKP